jgi:hypothetical protein
MTINMNKIVLTDEHKRTIAKTLAGRKVKLELVYRQLEEAVNVYQILERGRIKWPPQQTREYLQHIHEQISDVVIWLGDDQEKWLAELNHFQQHPPITGYDKIESVLHERNTELAVLKTLQRRIDSTIEDLDAQCHAFIKNSHPFRKNLYIGVLRIWTDVVGGELTFQQPRKGYGPPFGPLIDFFVAALRPILGSKTPNPPGIVAIIKRVERGNLIWKLPFYHSIPAGIKKRASRRLRNL